MISVSDKDGIVEFARELQKFDIDILASGGTYKVLSDAGLKVKSVTDITKYPEMLSGRVKTLHPAIHGGILAERSDKQHMKELHDLDIMPIDMVVANLYPFQDVAKKDPSNMDEIIEHIDIGGPALIRSAAKNFEHVTVVVNPSQYSKIIDELRAGNGISKDTRYLLAVEAFKHTSEYDSIIHEFLKSKDAEIFPNVLHLTFKKIQELKYGENPHQRGALYQNISTPSTIANFERLHGKDLTYNKILGFNTGLNIVRQFETPAVAIIKHINPCGVATSESLPESYVKAFEADPLSAFGGLVCLNRTVDLETAKLISEKFFDGIIAVGYESEALDILQQKKNTIIIKTGKIEHVESKIYFSSIDGGLLVGENKKLDIGNTMKVVTEIRPTDEQLKELFFAWNVVGNIISNAVVVTKGEKTLGIGAGQVSRIDATKIALTKAGENAKGAVLASDGFFPFKDSVEEAAKYGISTIIQPGGSIRDEEVIAAANALKIPMIFTNVRAFKH